MGTTELAVVGLAGSGLGTALGVPMVWPRAGRRAEAPLVGGWLMAVSALVFLISARLVGWLPMSVAVDHLVNLTGLTAYTLLYLYASVPTSPPASPARRVWPWTPLVVYVAVLLVRAALGLDTRVPFAWLLPIVLAFTAACILQMSRRQGRTTPPLVPAAWLVTFLVVLNAAQIVRMLFGDIAPVPALVPFVLTMEFVGLVGLVAWRSSGSATPATPAGAGSGARYEKSGLDEEMAQALVSRIERALAADRLFADPQLTLGRLAAAVSATPHQVSEALNRHSKVTFHDLVNRLRVEDVKLQLCDPSADRFTIEGIGASAGFGSRSALYAAFRRHEGTTPAEFRARRREERSSHVIAAEPQEQCSSPGSPPRGR